MELEVERLDEPLAASLARRVSEELDARAEMRGGEDCGLRIEAPDASLGELLHAVEAWGCVNGVPSICVRLSGRAYVLECRPDDSPRCAPA